jgi:hypothetical protein
LARVLGLSDVATTTRVEVLADRVCAMLTRLLSERQWLKSIRAYWRIENNSNWTADAFWSEDAKRTPWTTDPEAVYVMAALRMLAINIVAVMRAGSHQPGVPQGKLPWHLALRHMVAQLTAQADTGLEADIVCV